MRRSAPSGVLEPLRSPITCIARQAGPLAALTHRVGWTACVTNAAQKRLPWADAGWCERHAYRIERLFNRLKNRVQRTPLLVTRDDPIEGRTSLRTWGVRV